MKEAIIRADPIVKHNANFAGANTMTGRKIENAKISKSSPVPKKAKKYVNDVELGTWLHPPMNVSLLAVPNAGPRSFRILPLLLSVSFLSQPPVCLSFLPPPQRHPQHRTYPFSLIPATHHNIHLHAPARGTAVLCQKLAYALLCPLPLPFVSNPFKSLSALTTTFLPTASVRWRHCSMGA